MEELLKKKKKSMWLKWYDTHLLIWNLRSNLAHIVPMLQILENLDYWLSVLTVFVLLWFTLSKLSAPYAIHLFLELMCWQCMKSNISDPLEQLYSLTTEELPAFHNHSLSVSQTTLDFLKTSCARSPHEVETQR